MQTIHLRNIFISPEHGYVGRDPEDAPEQKMLSLDEVECVASKGIRGDRYFNHKENYKGQITFFPRKCSKPPVPMSGPAIDRPGPCAET